jgi:RsiW-degrading membrane proteinase PrsW (M82 family)
MLFCTYILYVLGAILPSLIFVFLFLSISKRIEFSFKFFVTSIVVGAFSTQMVLILHTIFPGFHEAMFQNKTLSLFILAFIQVGLIEEISKFFSFKLSLPAYRQRIEPITIFQISLIAAAAFSIMENLIYLDSGSSIKPEREEYCYISCLEYLLPPWFMEAMISIYL